MTIICLLFLLLLLFNRVDSGGQDRLASKLQRLEQGAEPSQGNAQQ